MEHIAIPIILVSLWVVEKLTEKQIKKKYRSYTDDFIKEGAKLYPSVIVYENVSETLYSHKVKSYLEDKDTSKFFVGCTYEPEYFYTKFKEVINYERNKDEPEDNANNKIMASHCLKQFEACFSSNSFPSLDLIIDLRQRYFSAMEEFHLFTHFRAMSNEHPNPDNSVRFLFVPFNVISNESNDIEKRNEYRTRNTKPIMFFFEVVLNFNIKCFVVDESDELLKDKKSDFIIFYVRKHLGREKKVIWNYNASSRELLQMRKTFPTDPDPLKDTQYEKILDCYENSVERPRHFMELGHFRERLFSD
jgi:hypothetical protein